MDELTSQLLEVLNARTRTVLEIAKVKRSLGLPMRDRRREEELFRMLVERNDGPLDGATIREVFQHVIDASVALASRTETPAGLCVESSGGPPVTVSAAGHTIGPGHAQYIAGPCSIENELQMEQVAAGLAQSGVRFLRGGAFKPRTSPYAFQGLKEEGLRLLQAAGRRHGMATVTEATSVANVDTVARYADVIQIGSRNMANFELLRAAGRTGLPILLKRGFGATLDEWLHAAEYVAVSGSERIVLCERGIRTFVRDTRNTLDLSVVPLALARSRLPVIVDVSHAAGRRDILAHLSTAAFAAGAQAVMIEVHPDPDAALSDSAQQITVEDFRALERSVFDALTHTANALREPTPTPESNRATERAL